MFSKGVTQIPIADDYVFSAMDRCRSLPLQKYAAIGDGRSVAVIGVNGTAAWWCIPNLDSPPLLDCLLNAASGNFFSVQPTEPYTAHQEYRENSNVLEMTFTTQGGVVRVTDSMNSTLAGRLPWCEFARRIEVLHGTVTMEVTLACATSGDTSSQPLQSTGDGGTFFRTGDVSAVLLASENIPLIETGHLVFSGTTVLHEGARALVAIVATGHQPFGVPTIEDIDRRIDLSDQAWKAWAEGLKYHGQYASTVTRSALALKLLLFSPSGAIAAAATTSLPEKVGGRKNYDYRYAWVRDASYTLHAFLWLGQLPESQAALSWLLRRLEAHGAKVCFGLEGDLVPPVSELPYAGYCGSRPVTVGNAAGAEHQHGIYGDIFEAAALFVARGNLLDPQSTQVLNRFADECAQRWMEKDSGMWELEETQHYTMSKISAWQALNRATNLAEKGFLPSENIPRWSREQDRIADWVNEHCWSQELKSYTFYPGTKRLDASLFLAVRFAFPSVERLSSTCDAIRDQLSRGPWIYRYSGAEGEEGAFLPCTFWLAGAYATLGRKTEANELIAEALNQLPKNTGVLSEMIDPGSGDFLGNLPQGLSHLALVHAVMSLG